MKTTILIRLKYIRSTIITGLLLIIAHGGLFATHIVGGEITYDHISGNIYKVRLEFYRDCAGVPAPTSATVTARSVSCGVTNVSASLSQVGTPVLVSPLCAGSLINSTCNGGLLYSITKYTYEGVITLTANCNDWEFYYTECCRNAAITNLAAPFTDENYFSATLNNLDFPFNNSVRFGSTPTNMIPINTTSTLSWNAYDVDGDSLLFELVNARGGNPPVNLTYASGYTFQQPIASSLPTVLNASDGMLSVTPNALQVSVVAMKVSEFRNGLLIGTVFRDYQIVVESTSNNLPALSGINGSSSFITNVCPGDTLQFDVFSSDPDAGQNLSLAMNSAGTAAVLNVGSGQNPTGSVFWMPSAGDISSMPYVFTIDVNDDHCDYYGTQTYAYHIYVNGCNTNDVWPGDANSDGIANVYDLLAIGLALNDNGPVRPAASINWIAQPCPDWLNSFISGINHKHADTDGNGAVNLDDTTAIMLNYGLNHPLRNQLPGSFLNVADLTVTANYDTVGMQTAVNFDIALSTSADSIYGLAFRLYFDPALVNISTTQVTYIGSMFGTNGVNMVKLDKTIGNTGFVDIALSRIDQQNITGSGNIARVTIVTTDNVSGKVTLNVEPLDVEAVTAYEFPVTINTTGDEVVIDPNYLGVNENTLDNLLSVHPVPTHDLLYFDFKGNERIQSILFYDMNGKELMELNDPENKINIDLQSLAKGVYYMKTKIGENITVKKIVKI